MNPLSVVIPSLGRAPAERAAASVLASATSAGVDTEVIVVWQSAAEPSLPDGVRVVHAHEVSVSYARNRGAEEASSELVAFLDDDEVADERWVGRLPAALDGVDAVFGPIDPLDADGRPHCLLDHGAERVYEGYAPPWTVGSGGNMAFRREALLAIGGFDLRLGTGTIGLSGEETETIWRLLVAGRRIRWDPDLVVYHPTKTDEQIRASRYPYGFGSGRLLRQARRPRLVANYAHAVAHAHWRALRTRDRRAWDESFVFARGLADGMLRRREWRAPDLDGEPVPGAVRSAIAGRSLEPLAVPWSSRPHYIWRGEDAVLHAYVWPSEAQLQGPGSREAIRALPGVQRVPAVLAHARSADALWVLEERVFGSTARAGDAAGWWDAAASWIVGYAVHDGPPHGQTGEWRTDSEDWARGAPSELREDIGAALSRIEERPSGAAHGDLQTKNLILGPAGPTALDWEFCTPEAIRGLDLLLLAVTNAGIEPDADVVVGLAQGRNPAWGDVLGPFAALGLEGPVLHDTLLVLLAKWAANERRRHAALGTLPQAPSYERMLRRAAPFLASHARSA